MKKVILILLVFALIFLSACFGDNPDDGTIFYTVTFNTDGGTVIEDQEVKNGSKVTKPANPEKDGFIFSGIWKFGNFTWDFEVDIVTSDLVLVAEWIELTEAPSLIAMKEEAFSSIITWQQTNAALYEFKVSIKPVEAASFTELSGEIEIDNSGLIDKVTFTPDEVPQGGLYIVRVEASGDVVDSEVPLRFSGDGTEANPYLVDERLDLLALLDHEVYHDQHFMQVEDILTIVSAPIEITNERKVTFSGLYDGGNKSLSFVGNGGLFHEIAEGGIVKNVVIAPTTQLYAQESNLYAIGAIANYNYGLIEKIVSRASVENPRMQGALPTFNEVDTTNLETGAGSIAGLNGETGVIREVTVSGAGAIKASRASGGVVAYNFGVIEYASVTATLPAGNQANSGNSSNTYSYGGGIAGFNFGVIRFSAVTGRVFAQSAYSETGTGNEGKNVGFGGIAGYNEGMITESSFARSLSAKEFIDKSRAQELGDSANNLGVASIHGDLYIGGIVGINNGEITHVYVGGAIIGGRDFIGGITGLSLANGSIKHAYVFAEIAVKDQGGNKVLTPNDKTSLTLYEIAPEGAFDANSTLYKPLVNSETEETWAPGDLAAPKLPQFTGNDLEKIGNKFAASGVLLWQQGSVTGVHILLQAIALPFGATAQLEFEVLPLSAPDLFTMWSSSDENIVKVLGEGLIQGVGEGEATITVTTRDGGFTDTILVTVEDYIKVDEVEVSVDGFELPEPNNGNDRPDIEIGTVLTFDVTLLPENAAYQGYTLSSSNSRAEISGNEVTFVFGNTGPGNVSITVSFEDTSIASLEYRFKTIEVIEEPDPDDILIDEVLVTAGDFELPEVNNSNDRLQVEIDTVIILNIDILPLNATNQNYTITISNSRATVEGHEVTFVLGNGLGSVSIFIDFEDTSVGDNGRLNYRFETVMPEEEPDPEDILIESVIISGGDYELPSPNNTLDRPEVTIGTKITLMIDILPLDATNQNYTITISNSRATVEGHEVTFVLGNGLGSVSIFIDFEDTSIGDDGRFNYRFTTINQEG